MKYGMKGLPYETEENPQHRMKYGMNGLPYVKEGMPYGVACGTLAITNECTLTGRVERKEGKATRSRIIRNDFPCGIEITTTHPLPTEGMTYGMNGIPYGKEGNPYGTKG